MKGIYCELCTIECEYYFKENNIQFFKGVEVNIKELIPICKKCGNELFIRDIEEDNLLKLYNKYRDLTGTINPKDITEFRGKYNLSQRELTAILGWGKMTINRYERGALPSKSHSDLLKNLIENKKLLTNKVDEALEHERISAKTYEKINNARYEDDLLNELSITTLNTIFNKLERSKYNGYCKFDAEKIENLISYIADKVDNLYKTSLNKYLWFIDCLSYKERVKAITGLRYEKYPYGPVIENKGYEQIIALLNKKVLNEEIIDESMSTIINKIKSKKNYDMSCFSNEEINVINKVIEKLKYMSCGQISDKSHEEDGWLKTDSKELISFTHASTLKNF